MLSPFYEKEDSSIPLPNSYHRRLSGFDRVIVNLETAISTEKECVLSKKAVNISTSPVHLSLLKDIGIDTVNIANNHSSDCGSASHEKAKSILRNK